MTHFPVTALRSVDLETPDIGRSEHFYTSVWGLDLVTRHEGVTYLRASGTDHHGCHVSAPFRCGIRGDRRCITAPWGDAA
jgi:catechol-2,3-dioxygenase